ncbi:unnamed protein product [Effrenium voratum]|nr:unnamed protein product [Effrenium voratum]|mmetsp:Transcript_117068/g.278089  ORF Transcript_117068/g.278089 Transcript_117068/m.278089 type:complete len:283 (+) Transcript_117068:36-884(+)
MALDFIASADLHEVPEIVVRCLREHGSELAASAGLQALCFLVFYVLVKKFMPQTKDPVSLADTLFSIFFFPLLAFAALAASWQLCSDVEARWQGINFWSNFYLILYVSRMMVHLCLQPLEDMSWMMLLMMSTHHLISMVCYMIGLAHGRCHFWGCLDGCCEITTVFLNGLYLLNDTEVGGKKLKELCPPWVPALNGILLWLAFLVFRLMLFPLWLYYFYLDMQEAPGKTTHVVTNLERTVYPATTSVLLALSVSWFFPLTRGMMKAVNKAQAGGKDDKEKES